MKKALILVATGYEDVELIATVDTLNRSEIQTTLASIENINLVKGTFSAIVETIPINNIDYKSYDILILPGGNGVKILIKDSLTKEIVNYYSKEKKYIAAICAAPSILFEYGLLDGKKYTSYPGYAIGNGNTGNVTEVHNNIITARDYESSINFAKKIIETIK